MQDTISDTDKKDNNLSQSHKMHKGNSHKNGNWAILISGLLIAGSIIFTHFDTRGGSGFVDPDSLFAGRNLKTEEFYSGSTNSKIILLEYSDLECPFCKKFHNETMVKIREDYKDKLAIAYRHFPLEFHKKAPKEAEAALCAREQGGRGAYFDFMSKIFEITPANDGLDFALLPGIAKESGVKNIEEWQKCLDGNNYASYVQSDLEDGAAAGVQGTPNTFVLAKDGDGYKIITVINGARDYKYVSNVLDQAIKMYK
jgi:protein-disulfide isomerase